MCPLTEQTSHRCLCKHGVAAHINTLASVLNADSFDVKLYDAYIKH
jgi:hypothetical protein